jgi:hypothetical protein
MDPKLTLLFLLIGTIIGLSHINYEDLTQLKRGRNGQRWLGVVRRWRKS